MNYKEQDIEFDRTKIYEQLHYSPQPPEYNGSLPWIVQQQIAETNGIHYQDTVGKLKDYPVYNMPVESVEKGFMLDIGCGWGRWLLAGANKGYIPIGVDLRLEFCQAGLETLRNNNKNGYTIVADLKSLPFKENIFDLIWSYSVIQHTHKDRMLNCLSKIDQLLSINGYTFLEFPNRNGIRNKYVNVSMADINKDDYNSWNVRYYTIDEYKNIFEKEFGNFELQNHSFIGIGVLPEDLKYVSLKNKLLVGISLFGSLLTSIITPLINFSDSIYIKAHKNSNLKVQDYNSNAESVMKFLDLNSINPTDNLNVWPLLSCPVSGGDLILNDSKNALISSKAQLSYPIVSGIPILISSEASSL